MRCCRPTSAASSPVSRAIDENFVAKLLDIGTELRFPAGAVVSSPDEPAVGIDGDHVQ